MLFWVGVEIRKQLQRTGELKYLPCSQGISGFSVLCWTWMCTVHHLFTPGLWLQRKGSQRDHLNKGHFESSRSLFCVPGRRHQGGWLREIVKHLQTVLGQVHLVTYQWLPLHMDPKHYWRWLKSITVADGKVSGTFLAESQKMLTSSFLS